MQCNKQLSQHHQSSNQHQIAAKTPERFRAKVHTRCFCPKHNRTKFNLDISGFIKKLQNLTEFSSPRRQPLILEPSCRMGGASSCYCASAVKFQCRNSLGESTEIDHRRRYSLRIGAANSKASTNCNHHGSLHGNATTLHNTWVDADTQKIRSIVRRIVVIDDSLVILKVVHKLLCAFFPGDMIETILINSPVTYAQFVSSTTPEQCRSWDIVLMDQDLILSDNSIKLGTDLIGILRSFECNACIMMHSANTGPEDISLYESAGVDGVIEKCSRTLGYEVQNAYRMKKTPQQ